MTDTFWTNTIWYVLLGILTLFEFMIIMHKARRRKLTVAFFITIMGILLNFETGILIFLKSYAYYPMIIKTSPNPFDDVLAGNLFSQFSVAATVVLVVVLNLNYCWYFVFAIMYGMIEEIFLALGIYSHNWYRTWMTIVLVPLAFYIAKKMYRKIIQGIKPIFYYVYIFLGLFTLYVITILWGLQVAGYLAYRTTFLRDPINSFYFLSLSIFFLPSSILMMVIYFIKPKWYWKALMIIALYLFYYTCYRYNLVIIKEGLFIWVTTLTMVWMYLSVTLLDRLYDKDKKIIR